MPSPIQGGRAHNCRREAAKAFLEVAELGQHAGVTAVARQRLLVKPPGFGLDALVAVGLVPLEKLLHRALPSDTRRRPVCVAAHLRQPGACWSAAHPRLTVVDRILLVPWPHSATRRGFPQRRLLPAFADLIVSIMRRPAARRAEFLPDWPLTRLARSAVTRQDGTWRQPLWWRPGRQMSCPVDPLGRTTGASPSPTCRQPPTAVSGGPCSQATTCSPRASSSRLGSAPCSSAIPAPSWCSGTAAHCQSPWPNSSA